jgi:methylase of polypeptide subunit release factors
MKSGGVVALEFGDGQAEATREIFLSQGWEVDAVEADDSGRARILIARRPQSVKTRRV